MNRLVIIFFAFLFSLFTYAGVASEKYRTIVTSDAEIDDECSLVHFLLYLNDIDCEAIISSSSQYHAHDHKWAGDDWYVPYLDAYTKVYPQLVKHDSSYPSPEKVGGMFLLGNVDTEGEMEKVTPGSQRIVDVLLDRTDPRPVWIQAWGGTNTIARALKTIEELHPEEMARVAAKIRFYLIWEQDDTYQKYILPHWGRFNIPTIISDQFIAYFYHWKHYIPAPQQTVLEADWMNKNILKDHGPLCSLYKAQPNGDFRSEGDSPAFFHLIPTGLRSPENPSWGGWGGRYVKIRSNTWFDKVKEEGYAYPEGRWYTSNAWGRTKLKQLMSYPDSAEAQKNNALTALQQYLKPMWRWTIALQNDFAARADWCVKDYRDANHQPIVKCNKLNVKAKPGAKVKLNSKGTHDPDGNKLTYRWWQYSEADSYEGEVDVKGNNTQSAIITIPADAKGKDIHIVLEVTDDGKPALTRYTRVVISVN